MGVIYSKSLYIKVFFKRKTLCHKTKNFKKARSSTHFIKNPTVKTNLTGGDYVCRKYTFIFQKYLRGTQAMNKNITWN